MKHLIALFLSLLYLPIMKNIRTMVATGREVYGLRQVIWLLKGLQKNDYHDLAFDIAKRHHEHVLEVFKETDTFWEYYAPESANPGLLARPDFVGWTGLPPISVLIEVLFGTNSDFGKKTVDWKINLLEGHGIERYPIGENGELSFKCLARNSTNQQPKIEINSNLPLKLKLSWKGGEKELDLVAGLNKF